MQVYLAQLCSSSLFAPNLSTNKVIVSVAAFLHTLPVGQVALLFLTVSLFLSFLFPLLP